MMEAQPLSAIIALFDIFMHDDIFFMSIDDILIMSAADIFMLDIEEGSSCL